MEVPFSCEIELNEEDLELLLSNSSFIRSNDKNTSVRYLFGLLYDKIVVDPDEFNEIDIDWIEDEEGNSLN